jgi:hypothetical protein
MVMTCLSAVEGSRNLPPGPRRAGCMGLLTLLTTLAVAPGCANNSNDLLMPGVSDQAPTAAHRVTVAASSTAELWEHTASIASFSKVDDRELPSRGHNPPYWSGTVRVNPALEAAYRELGPTAVIPPGAIAVETHTNTQGGTQPHFAMVKREPGFDPQGGDWEYAIVDAEGHIQNRGVLPLCARCHADAPTDHLFGPRLSSRRHVGAAVPPGGEAAIGQDDDEALSPAEDERAGKPGSPPRKHGKRRKK